MLQRKLNEGEGMSALRRFNDSLGRLHSTNWRPALMPVLAELCFNLESFNPAFAHIVLMVQKSIGVSDYEARDEALRRLIVPLAGEYGMHNGEPQSGFSSTFPSLFSCSKGRVLCTVQSRNIHVPQSLHFEDAP